MGLGVRTAVDNTAVLFTVLDGKPVAEVDMTLERALVLVTGEELKSSLNASLVEEIKWAIVLMT